MSYGLISDHIVRWLREYLESSGASGFVIGISGGVDSAVSSTLAAMTGADTLCLTLPIHQPASHLDRAEEHMRFLVANHPNVRIARSDLSGAFDTFISSFPDCSSSERYAMAAANTRSRLRMTALYYYAGLDNLLVVGTGNKIEDFGVGFFTKYGDGGVDISPIADLNKTEVFELASSLGVPRSILQAPPTDGLFGDDRTDEQQIGASYPELEWAMARADEGATPQDFSAREREVFEIYIARNRANRHKMIPIPVCIIPPELREAD